LPIQLTEINLPIQVPLDGTMGIQKVTAPVMQMAAKTPFFLGDRVVYGFREDTDPRILAAAGALPERQKHPPS
jgi:hypothetical protein